MAKNLHRRIVKNEKHRIKRKQRKKMLRKEKQKGKELIFQIAKIIHQYFPDIFDRIQMIEDYRRKFKYQLVEIIIACIAMFIFKEGSRNAFNNDRAEEKFKKNYRKLFKVRLPHMDTVDQIMRVLNEDELEMLKKSLLQTLIKKKTLHRFRFLGKWFLVAVDATGVWSFPEKHCEHCLEKTSKNGKKTYFHNVLEAKLICENGISISLLTEWIENPGKDYDKQDCEIKAFRRMSKNLKQLYPRLPICIAADGLYPNETFLNICKENGWAHILTFKEGNMQSVWKEVHILKELEGESNQRTETICREKQRIRRSYIWVNDLDYRGYVINWIECREKVEDMDGNLLEEKRFVHLTDQKVTWSYATEISFYGRLRWKIENEGFNTQKNLGYKLQHKYSRVSLRAGKNYYQCLQIGHIINQLAEMCSTTRELLKGKITIKHLWKCLIGLLIYGDVDEEAIKTLCQSRSYLCLE